MSTILSKSLAETESVAKQLLSTIELGPKAVVIGLEGDLGSGKTAFTQAVGKILGVEERIASPTFVLEKVYEIDAAKAAQAGLEGFKRLIHIDAYRFEKEEELLHLGWEEVIQNRENLIFIEWPERVSGIMPEWAKEVRFKFVDEHTREITLPKAPSYA